MNERRTWVFLVIGGIGLLLLLVALLFDDVLDGLLDGLVPESEWLSLPSLAAATFAFGTTAYILEEQADLAVGPAVGGGAVLAILGGWIAVRFGRAALNMATDPTPQHEQLVGSMGRVVTVIAPGRVGEVLVTLSGQPVKITATSQDAKEISSGANIVVVSVQSPTRVTVEEASAFWGAPTQQKDIPL